MFPTLDNIMKSEGSVDYGRLVGSYIQQDDLAGAYHELSLVLAERTPFRILEKISMGIWQATGTNLLGRIDDFIDDIAAHKTEGGWVVIGCLLRSRLDANMPAAFNRCHKYLTGAEIWYIADILGERVPGPALLSDFNPALKLLDPWRADPNRWVRRVVGVAVHFWTKRSSLDIDRAQRLLFLLEPMFEERNLDALKGVGWGLKTIGKYYPDLTTDWLAYQLFEMKRHPRALILRKTLTYLPELQRTRILKELDL